MMLYPKILFLAFALLVTFPKHLSHDFNICLDAGYVHFQVYDSGFVAELQSHIISPNKNTLNGMFYLHIIPSKTSQNVNNEQWQHIHPPIVLYPWIVPLFTLWS